MKKSRKAKIMLIIPDGNIHKIKISGFSRSMREAPLTLTTLAALIPESIDAEIKLVDENVEKIPMDHPADIVGISVLTGTAPRAYQLADHFRGKNAVVVLGGVHVSILPEEAASHADVIVTGFAEKAWPDFLNDYINNSYKKVYKTENAENNLMADIPIPARNLQKSLRYNISDTVCATRGCMSKCGFCTIPTLGCGYSKRPVSHVIDDIRSFKSKNFAFNDVSLVDDVEYAKELFTAMIPLKKKWGGLVTIRAAKDAELIDLMRKSGCSYLLIGFESLSQVALQEINKNFNRYDEYKEMISLLHAQNISIQGCFIFGFDHDEKTVFEETVDKVNDLKVDIPRYAIMTPYPGTKLYQRLLDENRIISKNWADYDTQHVVFKPAQMTPGELYKGFTSAYRKTFTSRFILQRTLTSPHPLISLLGNYAYKIFVRKLDRKELVFNTGNSILSISKPVPDVEEILPNEPLTTVGGSHL